MKVVRTGCSGWIELDDQGQISERRQYMSAYLAEHKREVFLVPRHGQQQVCRKHSQEPEAGPLQALMRLPSPVPDILGSYSLQAQRR